MLLDWLLGIVGISALGILVDILVNKGETEKYVKGVFGLFTLFIVVSPIPELLNMDFKFESIFNTTVSNDSYEADNKFLKYFYAERYASEEEWIVKVINEKYSLDAVADIYFVESCPEEIDIVYVYLKNDGIRDAEENKHIIEEVTRTISSRLNIKKERVKAQWQKIST